MLCILESTEMLYFCLHMSTFWKRKQKAFSTMLQKTPFCSSPVAFVQREFSVRLRFAPESVRDGEGREREKLVF